MAESHSLIFGGTFDPVHHGHLIVARAAAETINARRVLLVPTAANPLKARQASDPAARLAMLRLAIGDDPLFGVSDVEIRRGQPSYTIDTVETLLGQAPEREKLSLLVGADSLQDLPQWHRVEDLLGCVRIRIAARPPLSRDDVIGTIRLLNDLPERYRQRLAEGVIETPLVDISATDIRRRIAAGKSCRYLLPAGVLDYIRTHGLYRDVSD